MNAVIDRRIVFAGCARNCAPHLPKVLANIDRIAGLFSDAAFVLIENDSRDTTRSLLREWSSRHAATRLITRDDFYVSAPRTIRLARLRSEYTALVRREFADRDYLLVMDCDDVNFRTIDPDAVLRAIEFLEQHRTCAGVFANSSTLYYDLWALRHPQLCPGDFLEEILDYAVRYRIPAAEAFTNLMATRLFELEQDGPPLEVDSAFGGLAIYRISSVLKNRAPFTGYKKKVLPSQKGWTEVGLQVCEHVSFHAGFRAHGETLYVLPWLINVDVQVRQFDARDWQHPIFDLGRHAGLLSRQDRILLALRRMRFWKLVKPAAHNQT